MNLRRFTPVPRGALILVGFLASRAPPADEWAAQPRAGRVDRREPLGQVQGRGETCASFSVRLPPATPIMRASWVALR